MAAATSSSTTLSSSINSPVQGGNPSSRPSPGMFSFPPGTTVQPNAGSFFPPAHGMNVGMSYGTYSPMTLPPAAPSTLPSSYASAAVSQAPIVSASYSSGRAPAQTLNYAQVASRQTATSPPGPHVSKLSPDQQQQRPPFQRSSSANSTSQASVGSFSSSSSSTTNPNSRPSSSAGNNARARAPNPAATSNKHAAGNSSLLQQQRPSTLKHELVPDSFIASGHAPPDQKLTGMPHRSGPLAPESALRNRTDSSALASAAQRKPVPRVADDGDDDAPLGLSARPRLDSHHSSSSSVSEATRGRPAAGTSGAASERSATPTPSTSSMDRPRSSMSTARAVNTSLNNAASPLSQANAPEPPSTPQGNKDKKTGLNKFKKAFGTSHSNGSATNTSNNNDASGSKTSNEGGKPKSHQPSDSLNSTTSSSSGASTSPPATPPDHELELASPVVYSNHDASLSSTTLDTQAEMEGAAPRRRKMSLFNGKMNASTDNISISSTMSSASQVLRKIGTFGGKLGKRNSLASIGSMFQKDRGRDDNDAQSEFGVSAATSGSKLRKGLKRSKGAPAAASVSLATVEQEAPPGHGSLTPAARLAREQQERYAQQEAKEKELRAQSERERAGSPASSEDRRLKLLEKEKSKLNKKSRKFWGKGSFGGNQSIGYTQDTDSPRASVDDLGRSIAEEDENSHEEYVSSQLAHSLPMPSVGSGSLFDEPSEWDERTPRQSTDPASSTMVAEPRQVLETIVPLDEPRSTFDEDTVSFTRPVQPFAAQSGNESGSDYEGSLYHGYQPGREPQPPMPSKAAPKPTRSILKQSRSTTDVDQYGKPRPTFDRSRSNSANSPAAANQARGHQRASSMQSLGHFLSDPFEASQQPSGHTKSASVAGIRGPSPYMNPAANVSEPLLGVSGSVAPPRAATSPPSKRLTFAANLSVHTTWPPAVYDRRGEAATCSRLTPALAQRIKDELNNYKLQEMEVHQHSRIYTHFFS